MDKKELLCVYSGLAMNGLLASTAGLPSASSKHKQLSNIPPLSVELAKALIHELEKENDREDRS